MSTLKRGVYPKLKFVFCYSRMDNLIRGFISRCGSELQEIIGGGNLNKHHNYVVKSKEWELTSMTRGKFIVEKTFERKVD